MNSTCPKECPFVQTGTQKFEQVYFAGRSTELVDLLVLYAELPEWFKGAVLKTVD